MLFGKLKNNKKNNTGFTLIELLVVIAIIGVLASVVLASFNSARKKARDTRRIADLNQLRNAMEMYYNDNGYYPKESGGANGIIGEGAGLDAMLAPYMPSIPVDPLGFSETYFTSRTSIYAFHTR